MDKRAIELAGITLTEKKWSGNIESKWTPAEGFFTGSAKSIVDGLLAAGEKKAMSRLNFYINRAGKNLSDEDKARLEKAKEMLSKKLVKEDLNMIRHLAGLPAQAAEPIVESSIDLSDAVDMWIDANKAYSFEGQKGVSHLTDLVKQLGYSNLDEFLSDNSGCLEAMVEWIRDQNVPEWIEYLTPETDSEEKDEE